MTPFLPPSSFSTPNLGFSRRTKAEGMRKRGREERGATSDVRASEGVSDTYILWGSVQPQPCQIFVVHFVYRKRHFALVCGRLIAPGGRAGSRVASASALPPSHDLHLRRLFNVCGGGRGGPSPSHTLHCSHSLHT